MAGRPVATLTEIPSQFVRRQSCGCGYRDPQRREPQSIATRHADIELDEDRRRIRELVAQAAGLGVEVEHLRVRSPRPTEAVIEIATERRAGLLVFGPDPSRFKPRFFSRVVKRIRKRVSCLLWVAGEGP